MPYLTVPEMQRLSTKRLLAYKKKKFPYRDLIRDQHIPPWMNNCGCADCKRHMPEILEYEKHFDLLILILNRREHVADRGLTGSKKLLTLRVPRKTLANGTLRVSPAR